jgi:hypothetical protein
MVRTLTQKQFQGLSLYRAFGVKVLCNCVIEGSAIVPVNVNIGVTGVVEITGSPSYVTDSYPITFVKRASSLQPAYM